jgi:hypothetical protein
MLSCRWDVPLTEATAAPGFSAGPAKWVRTVDGWERPETWWIDPAVPPRLHPLVVAAGQILVSALGLAACGGSETEGRSEGIAFGRRRTHSQRRQQAL